MTDSTNSNTVADATTNTNTATVSTETLLAVASEATKQPTKLAQGKEIFNQEMAKRGTVHLTNKAFRKTVRVRMMTELGVSRPSSGAMYNTAKKEVEAAALALKQAAIADGGTGEQFDLGLGRDPKVEKAAKEPGKRGRKSNADKEAEAKAAEVTGGVQTLKDIGNSTEPQADAQPATLNTDAISDENAGDTQAQPAEAAAAE
jgi:hypothetical protein